VLLARPTASNERSGLRVWRVVACMFIEASQQKSGFERVNVSHGKYTAVYHISHAIVVEGQGLSWEVVGGRRSL